MDIYFYIDKIEKYNIHQEAVVALIEDSFRQDIGGFTAAICKELNKILFTKQCNPNRINYKGGE